jgi:hypothetical protein
MEVAIGQTVTMDFTVHNPQSGQVSAADVLPTCQIFEDITDTPILTPTVTKRTGQVGDYRLTFIASKTNGFTAGKSYNVIVEATCGGITAKATIDSFILQSPLSLPVKTRI